jgi:hypothetical protein
MAFGQERLDVDGKQTSVVERFAPERRVAKLGDVNEAAGTFEGEIRDFVRRDVAQRRRPQVVSNVAETPPAHDELNGVIKRVSTAAMDEIDRVIIELQGVRDMLRDEGNRVTREVAGFASLSHAAITSMRVIADSLVQWKGAPNQH